MCFLEFLAKAKAPNAVVQVRQEAPGGAWLCWDSVGWGNATFSRLEELFDAGSLRIKPIKNSVVVSKKDWDSFLACCPVAGAGRPVSNPITVEWEE